MARDDHELVLTNGRFVTPTGVFEGWLLAAQGVIQAMGKGPPPTAETEVEANGRFVLPGLVDPEAHLGVTRSFAEDVAAESKAAVASGVTTWGLQQVVVNTMPTYLREPKKSDHVPWSGQVPHFIETIEKHSWVDAYLTAVLMTDEQAEEIPQLADEHGVTSYKMYMHLRPGPEKLSRRWYAGHRTHGFDDGTVYRAMEQIASLGYPGILSVHCENWEIAWMLEDRLRAQGRTDMRAWNEKSPAFVEAGHVRTYSYYARISGCPLHIQHVTTPETVTEIERARSEGTVVVGQTGPHYLILDHDQWKINVPLRSPETIEWLWSAVAERRIDSIGSDHIGQTKTREEMDKQNVWETLSGFPSRVEVMLPALLSAGVSEGRLTIEDVVRITAENPARIWGLYPTKGCIAVGSDADLVVVDLDRQMTIQKDNVQSAAPWSLYEGMSFRGWPSTIILGGVVACHWPDSAGTPTYAEHPTGGYVRRTPTRRPYRSDWRAPRV